MIKPFGAKAARFIMRPPEQDALLNILVGAVGSAKTWTLNAKLIKLLADGFWPGGIGLITATSKTTAKTNMLNDLFAILGEKRYKYNQQSGELVLCGRPFRVCGAGDEGSWKSIRGATVGIWLGDELTLYPQSFFDMAMTRLRLPMSRAYGTTNTATPFHFLKKDWIDNREKWERKIVWSENFTFEDNPNLLEEKRDEMRRMFTGVFKQRYIENLWVSAQGSIWGDVFPGENDRCLYNNTTRPIGLLNGYSRRYIGVDCGTDHPQVYLDVYDYEGKLWFDREYFWDSKATHRQKTNGEYAVDLKNFLGENRRFTQVTIPPECAAFGLELTKIGITYKDADNAVADGISLFASACEAGIIMVNRDGCPNLIRQASGYIWDAKAAERGIEQPVKKEDDAPDCARYVVKTFLNPWRVTAKA